MAGLEWLLFFAQLPTTPSSLRVNVGRRLREAGAISLQNGVWLLPFSPENTRYLQRLLAYVRQNQAGGQIFVSQPLDPTDQHELIDRFVAEREGEVAGFLEQCAAFNAATENDLHNQIFSFDVLEKKERDFERLRKWSVKIHKRDFFKIEASKVAVTTLRTCRQNLYEYTRLVFARKGFVAPIDGGLMSGGDQANEMGSER